jgi:hypothetical protein
VRSNLPKNLAWEDCGKTATYSQKKARSWSCRAGAKPSARAGHSAPSLTLKGRQELPKGSQSAPLGSFPRWVTASPQPNWNWLAVAIDFPLPSPRFGIGLLRHDVVLVCHSLRFCGSSIAGASRHQQGEPPVPATSESMQWRKSLARLYGQVQPCKK